MHTLMASTDRFAEVLLRHKSLFSSFDCVYLFGSSLKKQAVPKDVDLLIVYSEYSERILQNAESVCPALESILHLPIDLTVMSFDELQETDFLRKIKHYTRIK